MAASPATLIDAGSCSRLIPGIEQRAQQTQHVELHALDDLLGVAGPHTGSLRRSDIPTSRSQINPVNFVRSSHPGSAHLLIFVGGNATLIMPTGPVPIGPMSPADGFIIRETFTAKGKDYIATRVPSGR
jgi:hypothetical protein